MDQRLRLIVFRLAAAVSTFAAVPAGAAQPLAPLESLCARQLGATAARLAAVSSKAMIDCRLDLAAGDPIEPCPTADDQAMIDALTLRLETRAKLFCESVCSLSPEIECIADSLCPSLPLVGAAEACTAGARNRPFDMGKIGFPGPFCEAALGHSLRTSADLAACVHALTMGASETLVDAAFGPPATPPLSLGALVCQRTLARRTRRLAMTIQRTTTACHNDILRGTRVANPADCALVDPRIDLQTADAEARLVAGATESCSDAIVADLNLCGAGPGAITSRDAAIECLVDAAHEIAQSLTPPALRAYGAVSLLDAAYPPGPTCGDGAINQRADSFHPLGEECDGNDDAACPGACIPPGDLFECTCGDRPRLRLLIDSASTDIDQGWTGTGDDATVPDGSGYVIDLDDCSCSEMDGATCVGSAPDPVCTVHGAHRPRCSWDPPGAPTCDARGNGNFLEEDRDCWICDDFSSNPGAACTDESDCGTVCYDAGDVPGAACPGGQADCPDGQVCRGRCDHGPACIALPLAPPTPVVGGGAAICIMQKSRDDLTGTINIVTGEHSLAQRTRVNIYLGLLVSVPCPVCGAVCDGGPFEGDACLGSCEASGAPCRFASDCPSGEACTSDSVDCPEASCNLSLLCHGGPNDGAACRVEGETLEFGAVSSDCPPATANNITGNGLVVDYEPLTSEAVSLPATVPCTAPGYELFDCPCPDDGGRRTEPNGCAPTCDAGAELGQGCATGHRAAGRFTSCASGFNVGRACDEDTDCPDSSCSLNPTHCIGDPDFERDACATNADCGLGTCVDACPDGRCVPLCRPTLADPEEGECSAGPSSYTCSGAVDGFRTCYEQQASADCDAICDTSLTPCDERADCPPGEACVGACEQRRFCEAGGDGILGTVDDLIGAGVCSEGLPNCPLSPLAAEGGDVFNSTGGPSEPRSVAVFCLGRTSRTGVNTVIGVGGPGRVRRGGSYVTNGFTELPW